MPQRDETKNDIKGTKNAEKGNNSRRKEKQQKNAVLTHGAHNKERGIRILSLYYLYIIPILSLYYLYTIPILFLYYPYIISILSLYYPYTIRIVGG
jgi:hypothetical protein